MSDSPETTGKQAEYDPQLEINPSLELLRSIKSPADLKQLDVDQLPALADEIRQAICDQIARTGGHFASNLCVVELTLAMHYVFDFASDRLLWDVGHQCYPHKLLTGRQDLFPRLKQRDGMAGFPEPRESPYDLFSVGHAGTSISTAVGMARADTMLGEGHRRVVSLIGDASIVNGLAMEGLNNAGTLGRQFLVILNDNNMAIGHPQGALASYFDRVRVSHTYEELRKRAKEVIKRLPGGSMIEQAYHRMGEVTKAAIAHDHMFDNFGLVCLGPIDGHDIPTLVEMFAELKEFDHPVVLHCKTVKGKGYDFAEGDAFKFHAPKPFTIQDCRVEIKTGSGGKSFTNAFSDIMNDLMANDEKMYAITAAMPDGTGLDKVAPKFPDRTLDCGLCESHGMAMAAGMAKSGLKPFYAVYSTFSQRALDQAFQEVALQNLPVRVCMDRAGYVGGDGAPMHGFMDIAMYGIMPNCVLMAVRDEPTFAAALDFMRTYDAGPSFIRYPRSKVPAPLVKDVKPYQLGKGELVKPSKNKKPDLNILGYGIMVEIAAQAMKELEQQGYDVALYDGRFAKPIDHDLVRDLVESGAPLLTVEDHALIAGFGSLVLESCNEQGLTTKNVHRMGMPDKYLYHDSRDGQLEQAGLDASGVARKVREILDAAAKSAATPSVHIRPADTPAFKR